MTPNEMADALETGLVETYNGTARINAAHVTAAIAHLRAPAALPELPPSDEWRAQFIDALTDYRHASLRDIPIASKRVHELVRAYALAALAGRGQDTFALLTALKRIANTHRPAGDPHAAIGEANEMRRIAQAAIAASAGKEKA